MPDMDCAYPEETPTQPAVSDIEIVREALADWYSDYDEIAMDAYPPALAALDRIGEREERLLELAGKWRANGSSEMGFEAGFMRGAADEIESILGRAALSDEEKKDA